MKTKIINWITFLPLVGIIIFFGVTGMSQHADNLHQKSKQDSLSATIGVKIPDSTQIKAQVKHKRLSKIDSLKAVDSALAVRNEQGIKTVIQKKAKFEKYKENRKTPDALPIPSASPSLAIKPPVLPDSLDLKKKPKRSVFEKIRNFIRH